MNPIPIYDATAPIACTINPDDIPERIERLERMRREPARHRAHDRLDRLHTYFISTEPISDLSGLL